ncbi:hypothetical protein DNTS_026643 [Danionella cerebrum]|uniref:START domain-containing protein n=1 Tax=Danionella cerebrum TaxID=2873325 RepID=A0A553Q2Q8_9TELE|nr:hypothetical protein DNTS_026643 [Danionella translucida]
METAETRQPIREAKDTQGGTRAENELLISAATNRTEMGGVCPVDTQVLKETLLSYHRLEENVSVWRRPSQEFSGFLYKTEGMVQEGVQRIIEFIRPGDCRMKWDTLMTSMKILEEPAEGCCVVQYTTAGQLLNIISSREFVDFSVTGDCELGGRFSCGVSVYDAPAGRGLVRGFNHPCGWFCTPTQEPGQSLLTGYIHTELRGALPQKAVDTAMAGGLIRFYRDLQEALDKAEPEPL